MSLLDRINSEEEIRKEVTEKDRGSRVKYGMPNSKGRTPQTAPKLGDFPGDHLA